MENLHFNELKKELINGSSKKKHPFRYFSLATSNKNGPRQRTVVLRKIEHDTLNLLIYTDYRSQKVHDIQDHPLVSALFYHPKKLLQVRVEGKAHLITDSDVLKTYWSGIQEASKKDYTTERDPGTAISNPDAVDYDREHAHFCIIKIIPETFEYLKLKRPNHLRIQFTRKGAQWNGQFLVP